MRYIRTIIRKFGELREQYELFKFVLKKHKLDFIEHKAEKVMIECLTGPDFFLSCSHYEVDKQKEVTSEDQEAAFKYWETVKKEPLQETYAKFING